VSSAGSVGIGTTSPSKKLDIRAQGAVRATLGIYSEGDVPNDLFFGSNGIDQRYSLTGRGSSQGYDLMLYRKNGSWSPMTT